jgi:hypothetical protein
MKKFNLENLGLGTSDGLERSQMKSILGGNVNDEGDAKGCSTTCSSKTGWYACCNGVGALSKCKCYPNIEAHTCSSGGYGALSCSIED